MSVKVILARMVQLVLMTFIYSGVDVQETSMEGFVTYVSHTISFNEGFVIYVSYTIDFMKALYICKSCNRL